MANWQIAFLRRADLPFVRLLSTHPDQAWIDQLNTERRKVGSDHVSYELFEIIMDRFEKEWFDLVRQLSPLSLRFFQPADG
jgi:hypothetical protein